MKKHLISIGLCLCCLLMVSGCHKKIDPNGTVMVILKDNNSYWQSVESGIKQACSEDNLSYEVVMTKSDGDYATQNKAIENYKTHIENYKGLIIAPCSDTVYTCLAGQLNDNSSPLIIIDSPIPGGSSLQYTVYIGTNNTTAGEDLAKKALENDTDLASKEVTIFKLGKATSMEERANGIQSQLANANIVTLSEDEEKAVSEIATAAAAADVIFGTNLTTTKYILAADAADKISATLYGFDQDDDITAAITAGTLEGVMVQQSKEIGYTSIHYVLNNTSKENRVEYLSTKYITK